MRRSQDRLNVLHTSRFAVPRYVYGVPCNVCHAMCVMSHYVPRPIPSCDLCVEGQGEPGVSRVRVRALSCVLLKDGCATFMLNTA